MKLKTWWFFPASQRRPQRKLCGHHQKMQIPGMSDANDLTDEQKNVIGAAAAQANPNPETAKKASVDGP